MSEDEVNKAEEEVRKNTQKLEIALEHVGEALEDTSSKLTGVAEKVQDKIQHTRKKVAGAVGAVRETVNKPKRVARHAMEKIQRTAHQSEEMMKRKPFLFWSMVTAGGMAAIVGYYFGRKKLNVLVRENERELTPLVEEDTIHFIPKVTPNFYKTA
jgi:ElaB/YqjD/DUF883 family membrane-anchored ribosome-binding protein